MDPQWVQEKETIAWTEKLWRCDFKSGWGLCHASKSFLDTFGCILYLKFVWALMYTSSHRLPLPSSRFNEEEDMYCREGETALRDRHSLSLCARAGSCDGEIRARPRGVKTSLLLSYFYRPVSWRLLLWELAGGFPHVRRYKTGTTPTRTAQAKLTYVDEMPYTA